MDTDELGQVWSNPGHDDWAGLGSRMRNFVTDAAERRDVLVRLEPLVDEEGRPVPKNRLTPAMFIPAEARVRIRAQAVLDPHLDDPATIDPGDRRDQADFPTLMGVAAHEAGHAAHTTLVFPNGTPVRECTWAMLLEEPRMEGAVARRRPDLVKWLRASASDLVSDSELRFRLDEAGADPAESAFRVMILLGGRRAAGVLTEADVQLLREDVAAVITDDVLHSLEQLLRDAVAVPDGDANGLLNVTRKVLALLEESPGHEDQDDEDPDTGDGEGESEGEGQGGAESTAGDGTDEEGAGNPNEGTPNDDAKNQSEQAASGDQTPGTDQHGNANGHAQQMPCGSWTAGDLDDDIDPAQESPAPDHGGELDDRLDQRAHNTAENASQAGRDQVTADQAIDAPVEPSPEATAAKDAEEQAVKSAEAAWQNACGSSATQIRTHDVPPTPEVMEQARSLTGVLRRAQYRALNRTTRASVLPPGRLRMSEEVRRRGQVAAKVRPTATPYRQTHRREAQDPPLLVGFAGDVSGSMELWQEVTANLAWSLARAMRHVNGTIAAVAWNGGVKTTLTPGTAPAKVRVARCAGGSSGCPEAVASLDGALGLAHTEDAARVLVIVTDGVIGSSRAQVVIKVNRLAQRGVKVLWVTPTPDHLCEQATNVVLATPTQFGKVIGAAITDVLAQT